MASTEPASRRAKHCFIGFALKTVAFISFCYEWMSHEDSAAMREGQCNELFVAMEKK
jgi:hypothetical protein